MAHESTAVIPAGLVAPVEIPGLRPEMALDLVRRVLFGLFPRPGEHRRLRDARVLCAVLRLLETSLLLGLEQRMVVEGVLGLVVPERHRVVEPRVAVLQREVVLDHLSERRFCLNRHTTSWVRSACFDAGF